MPQALLEFLDVFFIVFHTAWTLFTAAGFVCKRTRRVHLAAVLLTALSWFGLGILYGWGYCFCTDWHWEVRYRLGKHDMPHSYVTFLIRELTGWHPDERLVDALVLAVFLVAFVAAVLLDWKRRISQRQSRRNGRTA